LPSVPSREVVCCETREVLGNNYERSHCFTGECRHVTPV
jgi:hypothetical protein